MLRNQSRFILLITGVFSLILGTYPYLCNFLAILSILLLILGFLKLYKPGFRFVLKPGIIGVSLGLTLLYLFIIYNIVEANVFVNISSILSLLIIGFILSFASFLTELI